MGCHRIETSPPLSSPPPLPSCHLNKRGISHPLGLQASGWGWQPVSPCRPCPTGEWCSCSSRIPRQTFLARRNGRVRLAALRQCLMGHQSARGWGGGFTASCSIDPSHSPSSPFFVPLMELLPGYYFHLPESWRGRRAGGAHQTIHRGEHQNGLVAAPTSIG